MGSHLLWADWDDGENRLYIIFNSLDENMQIFTFAIGILIEFWIGILYESLHSYRFLSQNLYQNITIDTCISVKKPSSSSSIKSMQAYY